MALWTVMNDDDTPHEGEIEVDEYGRFFNGWGPSPKWGIEAHGETDLTGEWRRASPYRWTATKVVRSSVDPGLRVTAAVEIWCGGKHPHRPTRWALNLKLGRTTRRITPYDKPGACGSIADALRRADALDLDEEIEDLVREAFTDDSRVRRIACVYKLENGELIPFATRLNIDYWWARNAHPYGVGTFFLLSWHYNLPREEWYLGVTEEQVSTYLSSGGCHHPEMKERVLAHGGWFPGTPEEILTIEQASA